MRHYRLLFGIITLVLAVTTLEVSPAFAQQIINRVNPSVLQVNPEVFKITESSRSGAGVNAVSLQNVKITSPNGGEKLVLDGSSHQITFSANLDQAKDGQYQFQLELWRNGSKVGNINCGPQAFSLENINTGFGMPQYKVGQYCVGGGAPENYFVAEPGSGYRIKVVTYLNGQVVTGDESDAGFTYVAGPPLGSPQVTVIKPNGGESYEVGKGGNVQFSFSGLSPYKFNHEAGFELFKDGQKLGNLISRQSLNMGVEINSYSMNIDQYQDQSLKAVMVKPGQGYKLRILIYENGQVVAQDDSDNSFSFTSPAKPNIASVVINGVKDLIERIWNIFKW